MRNSPVMKAPENARVFQIRHVPPGGFLCSPEPNLNAETKGDKGRLAISACGFGECFWRGAALLRNKPHPRVPQVRFGRAFSSRLAPHPKWTRWLGCAARNPRCSRAQGAPAIEGDTPKAIGEANAPTPLNSNCVSIISILDKMLTHFILPESLILYPRCASDKISFRFHCAKSRKLRFSERTLEALDLYAG